MQKIVETVKIKNKFNIYTTSYMGDAVLGRTIQENDLVVTFIADMNITEQCGIAASKGNQSIWLIMRKS